MFSPARIAHYFESIETTQTVWLGFSGGLDSSVLLHAMLSLIKQRCIALTATQLRVIHVNHGLSQHAQAWQAHCVKHCAALGVTLHTVTVNASQQGDQSPEACARVARYAAFAQFIEPGDILLTAHQQDDQAETLLIQLCRGAGVRGLASMAVQLPWQDGSHWRPLLNSSRTELLAYAQQQQLRWIDDDSNGNVRFTRNFLRLEVIPTLKQRWPQLSKNLARTAAHCAESAALLHELAAHDLATVQTVTRFCPATLSISALLKLSAARRNNVLRYWLQQLTGAAPSTQQLQNIVQEVMLSRASACPSLHWNKLVLRRYQAELCATQPTVAFDAQQIIPWDLTESLILPLIGTLVLESVSNPHAISYSKVATGQLSIRFRQFNIRCQPVGRSHSQSLKKMMQAWHIPPWERARVPLLYCDEKLVAVIGYCVCAEFATTQAEPGFLLKLIPTLAAAC